MLPTEHRSSEGSGNLAMFAAMGLASSRISALGNSNITQIGVTVDIGERLFVGANYLEASVYGFNSPWREASH